MGRRLREGMRAGRVGVGLGRLDGDMGVRVGRERGRGGAYRLNSQPASLRLDAGSAISLLSSASNTAFPRDKASSVKCIQKLSFEMPRGGGLGRDFTACRELILLLSALLLSERLARTAKKPIRHGRSAGGF